GQKCEAQHGSWTRTKKQREARLWSRPRITGRSAEQRAIVDGASACGEPEAMQRAEGGAWHRQGKGFLFFLLIHITGEEQWTDRDLVCSTAEPAAPGMNIQRWCHEDSLYAWWLLRDRGVSALLPIPPNGSYNAVNVEYSA